MAGKPKITDEKRKARGTARKDREVGVVVSWPHVTEVPDPPAWLSARAGIELWREMAPNLFAQRVFTTADVESFAHLCQLHGDIVDGYERQLRPRAAELSQLRMLFTEFGMTPASRTRVKAGEDVKQDNPFSNNGKAAKTPAN